MPVELVAALSLILAAVGVMGIVVPVLPGSLSIGAGFLVWALWGGSQWGWVGFAAGVTLLAIGMSAQYLITGRRLKQREIPNRSIIIGLVCGLVGMFIIPVLGLVIGFALGLLAGEYTRVRVLSEALSTSWAALKSLGLGLLVELACGVMATTLLVALVLVSFYG